MVYPLHGDFAIGYKHGTLAFMEQAKKSSLLMVKFL